MALNNAMMEQPTANAFNQVPQAAPQMTLADVLAMQGDAMASPTPLVGAMAAPTGGLFDPLNQMVVGRQALEMENQRAQQAQDAQNALLMYKDQQGQQAAAAEKAKYDNTVATLEAYFTQNPDKTGGLPPRQAAELKASGKMPSASGDLSSQISSGIREGMSPVQGKPTINDIEKQQLGAANLRSRITTLKKSAQAVEDKYWTMQGRLGSAVDDIAAKVGKDRPVAEQKGRQNFVRMVQDAGSMFDTYRKDITGAAASVRELDILKTRMPNADGIVNFDSKVDFFTKMENLDKFNAAAMKRLADIKAKGFEIVPQDDPNAPLIAVKDGQYIDVVGEFPLELYGFNLLEEAPEDRQTKVNSLVDKYRSK
jgi:hypothetical protein